MLHEVIDSDLQKKIIDLFSQFIKQSEIKPEDLFNILGSNNFDSKEELTQTEYIIMATMHKINMVLKNHYPHNPSLVDSWYYANKKELNNSSPNYYLSKHTDKLSAMLYLLDLETKLLW